MRLPARDLFDADLDRARRGSGCALCQIVREGDQQAMHSFLWEYCTDPHIGMQIRMSWGFCTFHTWSLAVVEHERIGDGLGISIVYQALLRPLQRLFSSDRPAKKHMPHPVLPTVPEVGSVHCRFCQLAQREESLFLTRLARRFQQQIESRDESAWSSLRTALCFPHLRHLLEVCSTEGGGKPPRWSLPRLSWHGRLGAPPEAATAHQIQVVAADLSAYAVQCALEAGDRRALAQQEWSQIARTLAFLVGEREALPVHLSSKAGRVATRQLLLLTGPRSQLQSASSKRCHLCAAAADTCIMICLKAFEHDGSFSASALCQNHHSILAAGILRSGLSVGQYRSWLKQQLEQQQAVLAHTEAWRVSQNDQPCIVCVQDHRE